MLADGATALLCNILEVFYAARAFSFQYKTIINYFIYYGGPRARQINDIAGQPPHVGRAGAGQ